ncbi:MAG TPA: PAS domain-containing sensor histidine kinase [Candidatus Saccharimonadales bacterium]|nr:PAS domain-containing sensor histidine kinase [Candidatus Saccharimonadales bacterium]
MAVKNATPQLRDRDASLGGLQEVSLHRRVQLIVAYSCIGAVSLFVFGLLHVLERNLSVGYAELALAAGMFLNAGFAYGTRRVVVAQSALLALILITLMLMLVSGGMQGTGIFWFFVFPIGAFFMTGHKTGVIWMGLLYVTTFVVVGLAYGGVFEVAYNIVTVRQMLACLLVVSVGIFLYQRTRDQARATLLARELDLRTEEMKAEVILENIGEAVVAIDPDEKVVLANQAAANMLGWAPDEMAGRAFADVAGVLDREGNAVAPAERPLAKALHTGKQVRLNGHYVRRNGTSFPVAIIATPISVKGEVRGAIGTFRDITSEQRIDRAKNSFVTLASHQLRTPISAISWVSEMLLSEEPKKMSDSQREGLEEIHQSSQRMSIIVSDLLTMASLDVGLLPVTPKQTNLADLAGAIVEEQIADHKDKKLHIKQGYDKSVPSLKVDAGLTKLILRHVIANAFKYTPEDGSISIEIARTPRKVHPESAGSVGIVISDSGYGIPQQVADRVFSKFFRADNIKSKDTEGTGLGLYMVRTLLDYVGGSITFTSTEDKGTVFVILLPLEGMPQKEPADALSMGQESSL